MNELLFVLGPLAMVAGLGVAIWGLVLEKRSSEARTRPASPRGEPETAKGSDARPATRIMACPACGRRLRLPASGGGFRVTCPGCRHAFELKPD